MKILAVYRGLPWPRSEGYHLRLLALAEAWADRHEVYLLSLIHDESQLRDLKLVRSLSFFSEVRTLQMPSRNWFGRLRTHWGRSPVSSFLAEWPGMDRQLEQTICSWKSEVGLDVAWIFDPWVDVLFHRAARQIPSLMDVCDCRTLYYQRRLEDPSLSFLKRCRFRQLLRRFQGLESFSLQSFPIATAVSPDDQQALLSLHPESRVEVIPNGVDGTRFSVPNDVVPETGKLLLFGNMDFLPNSDAAVYFAREILPLIQDKFPAATFSILGTSPSNEVKALQELPGVTVVGEVEDLRPWLARATMLVAPIRYGAGIKNKVLETAAASRPVVCSLRATASLHPDVVSHLRVAEDPSSFAEEVCALLQQPEKRQAIGAALKESVARHHTWDAAAQRYEALFQDLLIKS